MPSIEKMIGFLESKQHHKSNVHYSMGNDRYFNPNADCSSAVYTAMKVGGFISPTTPIGNTETLFKLKGTILKEVYSISDVKRGDIFILGAEGASAGAYGHTGIFLGGGKIIHCNYRNNGITINNMYTVLSGKRSYKERYFRLIASTSNINKSATSGVKFIKNEKAVARFLATTNVRTNPDLNGQIVDQYNKGQTVVYDSVYESNGYRWLSYIGRSGARRYVAYRSLSNPSDSWVVFERI